MFTMAYHPQWSNRKLQTHVITVKEDQHALDQCLYSDGIPLF